MCSMFVTVCRYVCILADSSYACLFGACRVSAACARVHARRHGIVGLDLDEADETGLGDADTGRVGGLASV